MKKLRLQIIDDKLEYCKRLEEYFVSSGYFEVIPSVHDGYEALSAFQTCTPDVVLLDMVMPRMDGIEFLRQVGQLGLNGCTKIIANSPFVDEALVRLAQSLGAAYFLAKPMELPYVLARVMDVAGGGAMSATEHAAFQTMLKKQRRDVSREEIIANYLRVLGVPAHLTGYPYLKESIDYCVERCGQRISLTTAVYPHVAAEFTTTPMRVERNVRSAIEWAWDNGGVSNIDAQHKIFGYTVSDQKGRPTNKEFIAMLSDRTAQKLKHR